MIVIKVWCLPDQSEKDLNRLYREIIEDVKDVMSVPEICLQAKNDIVCLFPADLMRYGLGDEIIVEIDGLPDLDVGTKASKLNRIVRERLTKYIGKSVSVFYPKAKVKCSVSDFDPSQVVWTSA